jgi:hypothetical protein
LSADVAWAPIDLGEAERPGTVVRALSVAAGSNVASLQADGWRAGILRASPDQVTAALFEAFGGPATEAVPVIVFNGNGVPGTALIVVGSPEDVALAGRVRDLLGVGSVSVSVGSGIAPVTIFVGKDFSG